MKFKTLLGNYLKVFFALCVFVASISTRKLLQIFHLDLTEFVIPLGMFLLAICQVIFLGGIVLAVLKFNRLFKG